MNLTGKFFQWLCEKKHIKDPDVELFYAVFMKNASFVRDALDKGADRTVTDVMLVKRYQALYDEFCIISRRVFFGWLRKEKQINDPDVEYIYAILIKDDKLRNEALVNGANEIVTEILLIQKYNAEYKEFMNDKLISV